MKQRLLRIGVLMLLLFAVVSGAKELLNSSFDISRELFAELNPLFEKEWQQQSGEKLTIKQSHAGSSRQALAILNGLRADVVTYNQVTDIQILHDRGNLLPADWQSRLPHNSSPFYSTMAFLVRKGNPQQIRDWQDLLRDKVQLVFPNPKTSGNGRYTYLAAWGAQQQAEGNDEQKTRAWMRRFLRNVAVFDVGGRGATATFAERGIGDVLISFEAEVKNIQKQYADQQFEVVIPTVNILAEMPVTWVDKNVVRNQTEKEAKAYLAFLYSEAAQRVVLRHNYRVVNQKLMAEAGDAFPQVRMFRLEEQIGGWPEVMKTHFSQGGTLDQLLAEGRQ